MGRIVAFSKWDELTLGTNCRFLEFGTNCRLGRIVAWDELSLGTNCRLGRIVAWDESSLGTNCRPTIHSVAKYQKLMGGRKKNFGKKLRNLNSLTVPKKGGKSHSVEKSRKGTLLLWNGILSNVSGFGCVENEVLSTYGKSALMHKKSTDRVQLTKKTSHCKSRDFLRKRRLKTL